MFVHFTLQFISLHSSFHFTVLVTSQFIITVLHHSLHSSSIFTSQLQWFRRNPVRRHFPLGVEIRKGSSLLQVRIHPIVYGSESPVDASPRCLRHQYIHVGLLVDLVVPLVDSFAAEFVLLSSKTEIRLTTQGHNSIPTVSLFKQSGGPLVVSCVFRCVRSGKPKVLLCCISFL